MATMVKATSSETCCSRLGAMETIGGTWTVNRYKGRNCKYSENRIYHFKLSDYYGLRGIVSICFLVEFTYF